MSNERMRILRMVAEGKITAEDGERLLARLVPAGSATATADPTADDAERTPAPIKYLRVLVEGSDRINVRVPIALIRTGIRLTTLIPLGASKHLSEHGIDLTRFNDLDGEELLEALRELKVEVDAGDGDTVRVFCE